MMLDKLDYLQEECRNDYFISSKMKKVWKIQIEMFKEVERICKKHNISYFADSGTLLGAVRHNGFIPWDDDIDLGMTRDNYEHFRKVVNEELDSKYFFQVNETEKNFFRVHGQLRCNNTTMLIKYDYNRQYHRGIFIDIFVYDKVPMNEKEDSHLRKKLEMMKKLIIYKQDVYNTGIKRLIKNVIGNIGVLLMGGFNKAVKKFEKVCAKYNYLTDNYYYDVLGYNTNHKKFRMDAKMIENKTVPTAFEYTTIEIISDYDSYLREMYGNNYMTPIKASTDHGCLFIDLNNNYSKYDNLSKLEFEELFNG